tara:strand:+ start:2162 stop:2956 length:795 start_codon:yes stop_codon:yes gene_type:complete
MADQLVVPTDQEEMSAEDQYNQEMIDKVDGNDMATERPALDNSGDKFQGDYGKLKESYEALERKMHGTQEGEDIPVDVQEDLGIPQDVPVAEGAFDMNALTQEYTENGSLSENSYKQLEDAGISQEMTNQYIAGQKALGAQIGNDVKNTVGGEENYNGMVEWAKTNYSQDQIIAYDNAVNSGNIELAKMAAKGLQSDYQNTEGVEGKIYGGKQAAPEGGHGDVFRSNAEVTTAMKDPRYDSDHAFRQDVRDKLERSDLFNQGRL